jgi:hypothetical protein
MFVWAFEQWCKVVNVVKEHECMLIELADGGCTVVLFSEVAAVCKT